MASKNKKSLSQDQQNAKDAYAKAVEGILKYRKDYLDETFKDCYPQAAKISKKWTDTIWTDAMQIMQDFPSEYTKNAAICFFAFAGQIVDMCLAEKFNRKVNEKDLPAVVQVPATSELIKSLVTKADEFCGTEGALLIKNLLERDFGYFFAVLKAIDIENKALNNLLISQFRMFVWEIMLPHLFASEKKQDSAHA